MTFLLWQNLITSGVDEKWIHEQVTEEVAIRQLLHYIVQGYDLEVEGGRTIRIHVRNRNKKPRRIFLIDIES